MEELPLNKDHINLSDIYKYVKKLLKPETGFFGVVIVYGLAIAALTLAVPIAVQTLVNTIANIASTRAVITLSLVLFGTLVFSGIISALRMRVMEHYERRFYARMTADLSLKTIMAPHSFFEARKNINITNHYFEIMTFQKNLPSLMVDGFALVLQMFVGFTLVSFYHPALFAFNLVLLILLYLIWKIWSGGAKRTAIKLSDAKYQTAKWLNDIASAHEFFKSSRHLEYASKATEKYISNYVHKHEQHFVYTFTQGIFFLLLYAFASATLLGLGGWLVVIDQLSIGQLVAAELIMSAVFFGLSRFSTYLKLYYELYGAASKFKKSLTIPQEELHESDWEPDDCDNSLIFRGLELEHLNEKCTINLDLASGAKVCLLTNNNWTQNKVINLLKSYDTPPLGQINFGHRELSDYDTFELRQMIWTVDRSLIVECSIKDFMRMSAPKASLADIHRTLEATGLFEVIDSLPDGLDTQMTPLGSPLQSSDFLVLKVAAALLGKPKILILNQHFDTVPHAIRSQLLSLLSRQSFMILYFTNQPCPDAFDGIINLNNGILPGAGASDDTASGEESL